MLSINSPFLNMPTALDQKQAVFFDGIRHAAQIVELSYTRLCRALTSLSIHPPTETENFEFTHIFLDAWAFIDATDRFRCLWEMQPNASTIPRKFSPNTLRTQLQDIREARNVSAHIAQKIDQIVSHNSSVLGAISWVSVSNHASTKMSTHFIRPGILRGTVKEQFATPIGSVIVNHGSGCISLTAGKHKAKLSEAYEIVRSTIEFAEKRLKIVFQNSSAQQFIPNDMFGSADLVTNDR